MRQRPYYQIGKFQNPLRESWHGLKSMEAVMKTLQDPSSVYPKEVLQSLETLTAQMEIFSEKTSADRDLFLMKLKDDGSLLWKKTYGGSGDDHGNSLLQTPDGGFVLLGYRSSQDGDVNPTKGFHDNWILKVDKSGNIEWQNTYGFEGHDHAYNVISTADGGYFFNGFLDVTASGGEGNDGRSASRNRHGAGEFWCHKLDAQWQPRMAALLWRNQQ